MTESMYFGVPLLALPMFYDQFLQARLAADIGVGIEILRGENGQTHRDEVALAIQMVATENAVRE